MTPPPIVAALGRSERLVEALEYASELHADQRRKGTDIPYVAHLLAVCALVLEAGGDEDQAVAALLHDAVEDQGGAPILREIRRRFGRRVAGIVDSCSDTDVWPKPEWKDRKRTYIEGLNTASPEALLVSLADKANNARSILGDYLELGEKLWSRFTGTAEQQLWYYRSLAELFTRRFPGPLASELDRTVRDLESEVCGREGRTPQA